MVYGQQLRTAIGQELPVKARRTMGSYAAKANNDESSQMPMIGSKR
jgi:hypothetical protein